MAHPVALADIYWLAPEEGGRKQPPSGPVYAATARFAEDAPDQLFSVVLRSTEVPPGGEQNMRKVKISLLAPDQLPEVKARLQAGSALLITEGARTVAKGEVRSVSTDDTVNGSPPAHPLGRSSKL